MGYRAAIFDLDGTLIDSTWVWEVMIKKFCDVLNLKDMSDYMNSTAHMGPTEFINFVKKEHNLTQEVGEIKDILLRSAKELYSTKVPLKKGALRLLNLMTDNSIKLSIATSCFVELTEIVLKRWDVYDKFSFFAYSEQLGTNKKSADVYLKAANKMGVSFSECAVFEDILFPLKAVKAQNMGFFAVEDKKRSEDIKKELKANADFYIKDFDEFIDNGHFEEFFIS